MDMTGQNGNISLDKILLIDSSLPLNLLNNIENQYQKIITFDFISHKSLVTYGIQHEISDTYLTHQELQELQEKTLELSTWSKQKEISQFVEYDSINLGNLVFNNFIDFIAGFLKKFCEVQKIVEQNIDCEFICSETMCGMVKIFSNNIVVMKKQTKSENKKFVYTYRFGHISFQISLTREQYVKLKNLTESVFSKVTSFVNRKNNLVLFVEFDPIKYKKLLLSQNNDSNNFILYNRRRPAIWNFESFNVIRKAKCNVITFVNLIEPRLQSKIDTGLQLIGKKLDNLWNESFFDVFFSINGVSFWAALRPFFEKNLSVVIRDLVQEVELAKKIFEKYDIKTILILSEIGPHEQILMNLAQRNGKNVVMMQHGVPYETKEASKRNNLSGFFPNFSDAMIVWGQLTKKYLEISGTPTSKLKPLGNSPYDELTVGAHNVEDIILLATSPPMKDIVYDNLVTTNEQYQNAIESICRITTKLKQKLVIKLHPSLVDFDIESMVKQINKDIEVINSGSIFPFITNCKFLITFDLSTTILEAQILQKPAISITLKDYGFGDSDVFKSDSCICTTINDLEYHVKKLLTDDSYKKKYIDNGNKFADTYLENRGHATESIYKFLREL